MKFSIIIPTYNRDREIKRLFNSLLFLYNQFNEDDFEIIILNDGGNVLLEMPNFNKNNLILINNETNIGRAKIRNQGGKVAKGDILFFIDDDIEIKEENIFARYFEAYEKQGADAIFSNVIYIKDENHGSKNLNTYMNMRAIANCSDVKIDKGNHFLSGFSSIKKTIFTKLNGFDENFSGYGWEDPDFGMMLEENGYKIFVIKSDKLLHYHNKTVKEWAYQMSNSNKNFLYMIKKHPILIDRFKLNKLKNPILILLFNKFFLKIAIVLAKTALYYFAIRYIYIYSIYSCLKNEKR